VTATKAKSFLKRVNNKIVPVEGKDLRVGEYVPVSKILPTRDVSPIDNLDVSLFLPKTEYIYMSEVDKALKHREEVGRKWTHELGKSIILPYNRADSLIAAFIGQPKRPPTNTALLANCVYPKKTMGEDMISHVPENIPLDHDFGWLVGAYLSEGCIAVGANKKGAAQRPYAVLICNMSKEFHELVDRFAKRYEISYHVDEGTRNMASGYVGYTKTLRMHSLILGELFMRMFGNGAASKRIHPSLLGAPDEFLKGLVDGYFSGDGMVSKKDNYMNAYSASRGLLDDLQQILSRYSIHTGIKQMSEKAYEYNTSKYKTTVRGWTMSFSVVDTKKFRDHFTLCVNYKQDRLNEMQTRLEFGLKDIVPDIVTSSGCTFSVNRAEISKLITTVQSEEDLQILRNIQDENIVYDRIISIEEIPNDRPWVYDLTVENTRNFNLYSGLACRDTFHLSGYSSASTAVRGVPRLKELLHVSKNIKTPIMTIYVKPEYSQDKNKCKEIMNTIQTTHLSDIVKNSSIFYDPNDTVVSLDKPFLDVYNEWRQVNEGLCPKISNNPWLLRMEFDRSKMLDMEVTMIDIERVLYDRFEDQVSCLFSDDNADQLVCRIRIIDDDKTVDDMLTHLKALEQSLMESVSIKGTEKIKKASMFKRDFDKVEDLGKPDNEGITMYDDNTDEFRRTYEWVLETDGTNLKELLANGYIDTTRTISNDVVEIHNILGIEAARRALYDEIMAVLATAFVNYCHVSLLIDTMTNKGHLSSINRHGINRTDIGPLAKSSFEETTDILVKAGVFAEHDKMMGISANVMLGQIPRFGTGDSEIFMDPAALGNTRPLLPPIVEMPETSPQRAEDAVGNATADMFTMNIDI
jgi:DNA-directed RNA polymerase beta' subunit